MQYGKVEICGVNTSNLPLIRNEDQKEYLIRIKNGDHEARETFIRSNLRLVLSVLRRFPNASENMDDLFQIGCVGLMKAIDHFDLRYNVLFSSYCVPMIQGEIRRFLRDCASGIRVSRSIKDTACKAFYARELYRKEKQKEPTLTEIATEIGISEEEISYAMDAMQTPVSLYEPVYTEGGDTLYVMDQISDKKNREENWVTDLSLSAALERLSPREHHIITLRYFEGKTQTEVSSIIGISQAQVSRLEKNALAQMRDYLE